jgi:hypothetical protein
MIYLVLVVLLELKKQYHEILLEKLCVRILFSSFSCNWTFVKLNFSKKSRRIVHFRFLSASKTSATNWFGYLCFSRLD